MITRNKFQNLHRSCEDGYTIMEGLVAMIMVAFLMSAVAPVIAISVGTRVQARRAELAAQAARSYIEAVNSGAIPAVNSDGTANANALDGTDVINKANTSFTVGKLTSCQQIPSECSNLTVGSGKFYCVDGDGDGVCTPEKQADMIVHAGVQIPDGVTSDYTSQLTGADAEKLSEIGYLLSVRVYRASAFKDADSISTAQPATLTNNAGLATRYTSNGSNVEKPLFSTVTQIAPESNSFSTWKTLLKQ